MNQDFIKALDALQEEKNIDKEELIDAIETSIASAYQKNYHTYNQVDVEIDRETGEIIVYENKEIKENVENPNTEISIEEAREIDPNYDIGDIYRYKIIPKDFGRIAAQNAKQLIMQRIKEAEKNLIYDEYIGRLEELINGTVTRVENGNIFVNIGKTEALLPPGEQIKNEEYYRGQRLKVYLLSVKKTNKGPQIKVSRSHPGLIKRLFEEEVPEIYEGTVEINGVSRDAGHRSKVSVVSNNPSVEPVGACVGQRGVRIQNILSELGEEKIDIVPYSDNFAEYLKNALSPAKIERIITNEKDRNAIVVVNDNQLSLAIGKEGSNVRLAAKLTGWKIDIKSKSDYEELLKEEPTFEEDFMGIESEMQDQDDFDFLDDEIFDMDLDDIDNDSEEEEPYNDPLDDIINSDEEILDNLFE